MKNLLFVVLGALLFCAIMWFAVTHYPDGAGRWVSLLIATAVFALCAFGPGRLWGKNNTLNSFALPLVLLLMQEPTAGPHWDIALMYLALILVLAARVWATAPRIARPAATPKKPWYQLRRS